MADPVLVEVTRGPVVESRHRGAIAIVDVNGKRRAAIGDVEQAVFPRSAVKALQALPLVESGAADRYGFGSPELALACSSHNGERRHVRTATAMLAAAGRGIANLECGPQMPCESAARELILAGKSPTAIHNNCSGKHSGFICFACHTGLEPAGYVQPDHPVQREITATLSAMTDTILDERNRGVDGCSIPTYAVPLTALARGFARFGTGQGFGPKRAEAARRIREAVAAHPFMVAGTGRFDTRLMERFGQRAFIKTGAEGVYCGALPELGYGIALKCDDGAGRAAEVAMAALIERFLPLNGEEQAAFAPFRETVLTNWNGIEVGRVRAAESLRG